MRSETVAFVLCSRPESSRLPEKVFQKVAGIPILRHISNRADGIDARLVLALPRAVAASAKYDALYHSLWQGEFFYGSDTSPLHRMAEFLHDNPKVEWVVRATHDDPIIDAEEANRLTMACMAAGAGYGVTTSIIQGAGVEVIRRDNILAAAATYDDTEYVSYFVRGGEMPYPKVVRLGARFAVCSEARLTVDYPADLELLRAVMTAVGRNASTEKVVSFLESGTAKYWNKLPDLTIYTCVKNGEETISRAVESALRVADLIETEHIVVDDGSTDGTLAAVLGSTDPSKTRIISNSVNLGLATSSNIAANAASGRWVMRLDADDVIHNPGEVVEMIRMARERDLQFVYPTFVESDGGDLTGPIDPRVSHHAGCSLMDRAALNELRFRDGLRHWDSAELHRRIEASGLGIGYYETAPVWTYTKRKGQMSEPTEERTRTKSRLGL